MRFCEASGMTTRSFDNSRFGCLEDLANEYFVEENDCKHDESDDPEPFKF